MFSPASKSTTYGRFRLCAALAILFSAPLFAEVNSALEFDRDATVGFRLDIPAGTAARLQ